MPAAGVADILYEALDEIKHHREIAEAAGRESLTKSVALVYLDPETQEFVVGKRVVCDYETKITSRMGCDLLFRSAFNLEVKDFGAAKPNGVAVYRGSELVSCQSLSAFGVRHPLWPGDTIEVEPANGDLQERTDAAWRAWQSEESRDRGYDRDKCARLRDEYYSLLEELEKNNAKDI